jgi:hypothetical protein
MGVWQGVAMDTLKFQQGPLCPTLLRSVGQAVSGVALPEGRRPAAFFYTLGHPTSYNYADIRK